MKKVLSLLVVLTGLLALTSVARADPIGTPDNPCEQDSCFGNVFTLNYFVNSPTDYRIFISVDTSGYTGSGNFLSDLAFKIVAQDADITSVLFVDAPGDPGTQWTLHTGNLNADGCGGAGGGWLCVSTTESSLTPVPGGTYLFVFDIEVGNAGDWLLDSASIQARYGILGNLTSEPITMQECINCPGGDIPLPEPATLLLFGLGLLGLATQRRLMR